MGGNSQDSGSNPPQADAGLTITCGRGTVLDGTTCVLEDAGAGGSGGQAADGGTAGSGDTNVTCGPGTMLKDNQCVPADSVTDGLSIDTFTATKLSGDVPLDTTLTWSIRAPQGAKFSCELDPDGDGTFETQVANCKTTGKYDVTYDTFGEKKPALRVVPEGGNGAAQASERIFANYVKWAPNLVKVHELAGLVSSTLVDADTVNLTFDQAANVLSIRAGALVWDRRAGGYVRNVTSASVSGTTVTLKITDASIFDIATGGFWGRRDREELQTKSLGGDACDPSKFSPAWDVHVLDVGDTKIRKGKGFVEVSAGKLLIAYRIFDPSLSFGLMQENIFQSKVMVKTRFCGGVEMGLEAKLEKSVPIPMPGGVDLDFLFFHATGEFVPQVGFEAKGTIKGGFDTVFGTFYTATIDYRSEHGGFQPNTGLVVKDSPLTGLYNPHVSAEGEVKLFIKPALELSWNGNDGDCDEGKT